jgi:hypothetical protein
MVGGSGADSFYIDQQVQNKKNLYVYDLSGEANKLPSPALARIRTSSDSSVNYFDRKSFEYDRSGPEAAIQYDLDLGLLLSGGIISEKQGFRKTPYARRHAFFVNFAPARKSFLLSYNADLKQQFGKNDLAVNLVLRGPHNVSSFFGVGNETQFEKDGKGISFYRNRYDYFNGDVRLYRQLGQRVKVNMGLGLQYYTSKEKNNADRLLGRYNAEQPADQVFSSQAFTGVVGGIEVNSNKRSFQTTRGIYWNMQLTGMKQVNGDQKSYGQIQSQAIFYLPLSTSVVLANRIGWGTSIGKPAFYQQFQLGGYNTLRGFFPNRFTGRTAVYHSIELRAKLLDFTSYLFPGTLGMTVFNDLGRVWVPGESSNKWHRGFGAGIFIIPADLILIEAAISKSVEGTQPYISIGFDF